MPFIGVQYRSRNLTLQTVSSIFQSILLKGKRQCFAHLESVWFYNIIAVMNINRGIATSN